MSGIDMMSALINKSNLPTNQVAAPVGAFAYWAMNENGQGVIPGSIANVDVDAFTLNYGDSFTNVNSVTGGNTIVRKLYQHLPETGLLHKFWSENDSVMRYRADAPSLQSGMTDGGINLGWNASNLIDGIFLFNGTYTVLMSDFSIGSARMRTYRGAAVNSSMTTIGSGEDGSGFNNKDCVMNTDGIILGRTGNITARIRPVVAGVLGAILAGFSGSLQFGGSGQSVFVRGKRFFFATNTHIVWTEDGVTVLGESAITYDVAPSDTNLNLYAACGQYDVMVRGVEIYRATVGSSVFQKIGTLGGTSPTGILRTTFRYPYLYVACITTNNPTHFRIAI